MNGSLDDLTPAANRTATNNPALSQFGTLEFPKLRAAIQLPEIPFHLFLLIVYDTLLK